MSLNILLVDQDLKHAPPKAITLCFKSAIGKHDPITKNDHMETGMSLPPIAHARENNFFFAKLSFLEVLF